MVYGTGTGTGTGASVGNSNGNSFAIHPGQAVPCWKFGISAESMMAGALHGGMT